MGGCERVATIQQHARERTVWRLARIWHVCERSAHRVIARVLGNSEQRYSSVEDSMIDTHGALSVCVAQIAQALSRSSDAHKAHKTPGNGLQHGSKSPNKQASPNRSRRSVRSKRPVSTRRWKIARAYKRQVTNRHGTCVSQGQPLGPSPHTHKSHLRSVCRPCIIGRRAHAHHHLAQDSLTRPIDRR